MHITSGKIHHKKKRKIKGESKITNLDDLRRAIKDILDADICSDIVNLAYSEDGTFETDVFIDADTFWDVHSNDDVQEIILKFFNGEDLDSKGPANPNRDYFRLNGYENVESTDYPEEIYMDELDIEVIDYVLDHLEDAEYPDKVQKLVDNYLENMEE